MHLFLGKERPSVLVCAVDSTQAAFDEILAGLGSICNGGELDVWVISFLSIRPTTEVQEGISVTDCRMDEWEFAEKILDAYGNSSRGSCHSGRED